MISDYPCLRPVVSPYSGADKVIQCPGTMRLVDAVVEEMPLESATLTMKLLVCDKCGRSAIPEPDPAE